MEASFKAAFGDLKFTYLSIYICNSYYQEKCIQCTMYSTIYIMRYILYVYTNI